MASKIPIAAYSGTLKEISIGDRIPISVVASGTPTGVKFVRDDGVLARPVDNRLSVSGSDFDLAEATLFTKTISQATSFSVSNIPASGSVASFLLDLTNGGAYVITWWSGVKWAGGAAPSLTAAGRDVLGFFTHDGGTTWTGLMLGKDVR